MTIITKAYRAFFGFTISCCFVEYGDPSIPSWSYWIIPGSYEESL